MADEMRWDSVDPTALPYEAFLQEMDGTDPGNRNTWQFAHHCICDAEYGEDGQIVAGEMHPHHWAVLRTYAILCDVYGGPTAFRHISPGISGST